MPRVTLTTLPPEIIALILSHLLRSETTKFALTCRATVAPAQRALWRCVFIRNCKNLTRVANALASRPKVGLLVQLFEVGIYNYYDGLRYLSVTEITDQLYRCLGHLSNLLKLSVSNFRILSNLEALPPMPSVVYLKVDKIFWKSFAGLWNACSNVQCVSLSSLGSISGLLYPLQDRPVQRLLIDAKCLLTSSDLSRILQASPSLEDLEWCLYHGGQRSSYLTIDPEGPGTEELLSLFPGSAEISKLLSTKQLVYLSLQTSWFERDAYTDVFDRILLDNLQYAELNIEMASVNFFRQAKKLKGVTIQGGSSTVDAQKFIEIIKVMPTLTHLRLCISDKFRYAPDFEGRVHGKRKWTRDALNTAFRLQRTVQLMVDGTIFGVGDEDIIGWYYPGMTEPYFDWEWE